MERYYIKKKSTISKIDETISEDDFIAYLNQSKYGQWIIFDYLASSDNDKNVLRKRINEVIPHVINPESFISHLKYSVKSNLCSDLAFDCLINDFMAVSKEDIILSDEGYETFRERYNKELKEFIDEMKESEQDKVEEELMFQDYYSGDFSEYILNTDKELPL